MASLSPAEEDKYSCEVVVKEPKEGCSKGVKEKYGISEIFVAVARMVFLH